MRFEITSTSRRLADWSALNPRLHHSLLFGDNVLFHCMAGVHRAPLGAGLAVAWVARMSFPQAMSQIDLVRHIEPARAVRGVPDMQWVNAALRMHPPADRPCGGFVCMGTRNDNVVHAVEDLQASPLMPLCRRGGRGHRATLLGTPNFTADDIDAAGVWSCPFCASCVACLPASLFARLRSPPPLPAGAEIIDDNVSHL